MSYIIQLTELMRIFPETSYYVGINQHDILMDTPKKTLAKVYETAQAAQVVADVLNRNYDETNAEVIEL